MEKLSADNGKRMLEAVDNSPKRIKKQRLSTFAKDLKLRHFASVISRGCLHLFPYSFMISVNKMRQREWTNAIGL